MKEWDDSRQAYVETRRVGPTQPGELVAILYTGHGINPAGQAYPKFVVDREPPVTASTSAAEEPPAANDDDIQF